VSEDQEKFQCQGAGTCGYIYDPDRGDKKGKIPKGTAFENLPADWKCPGRGVSKDRFKCLGTRSASGKNGIREGEEKGS
jgi:rubredoxin